MRVYDKKERGIKRTMMDDLDVLMSKVENLVEQLKKLKEENTKLKKQIESFPYEELETLRKENKKLNEERAKLKEKLGIILTQLEKIEKWEKDKDIDQLPPEQLKL